MPKFGDPAYDGATTLASTDSILWKKAAGTRELTAAQVQRSFGGMFNVTQYGATGDGSTDDTTAIQTAIDAADDAPWLAGSVYFPAGTYLYSTLTMRSNVRLFGDAMRASILKRNAVTAANAGISCSGIHSFRFESLGFDGNKTNNSNPANNITISSSCYDFTIDRCRSHDAKYSGGYGSGVAVVDGANSANGTISTIKNSVFDLNGDAGVYISKDFSYIIDGNDFNTNSGCGLQIINYVFPPVSNAQLYFIVTDNHCRVNSNAGIVFSGYTIGGSAGAPFPGYTTPPSKGIVISGNICILNTKYGIVFQGVAGTISNNFCERNGDSTSNGGMLINAWLTTVSGNSLYDNYYYGCDMGGSAAVTFTGNVVAYNGSTSGAGAAGINLGASVDCSVTNNVFDANGTTGSAAINLSGYDAAGTIASGGSFTTIGVRATVANNIIRLPVVGAIGVYAHNGFDYLTLIGNQVSGGSAGQAYQLGGGLNTFNLIERDNVDQTNGGPLPTIASAATLVIPDVGNQFLISGTTNITSILTDAANVYSGKVRYVQMTNVGSGYNPASPPAVTFTGGGGASAAGTALIANDGTCIGVAMTNLGTGYTSAPTVGFASGAAAGVARVGCGNFDGRVITLMFQGALTFTNGSNLVLNGNLVSGGGGFEMVTLRGSYGVNWYEVSRRV